jgi:homoserine kinase
MLAKAPSTRNQVRVYAPGGIGNIGPALDVLGCAVTGAGDTIELEWSGGRDGFALRIEDPGHPDLTTDPTRHAAAIAAMAVIRVAGMRPSRVLVMRAAKGLPLAGGQGGSAASAVAGAVAMNELLGAPLDHVAILGTAVEAEAAVAGRHADNVASALLGGVTLVRCVSPLDVIRLPFPAALRVVLVQPHQQLRTADARAVLPASIDRALFIRQSANIAAMVAAFASADLELLRRSLDDQIAEPARARLLPGFAEAKAAALAAGALGCSISGAGPTSFAFAPTDGRAAEIGEAMSAAYESKGVKSTYRLARIDDQGARIVSS